jgi:carbonic anhydrase
MLLHPGAAGSGWTKYGNSGYELMIKRLTGSRDVTKLHALNDRHMSTSTGMIGMDEVSKERRMEEIYVLAEVDWMKRQPSVGKAIRERGLKVHAFCYDKMTEKCCELIEVEEEHMKWDVKSDMWTQSVVPDNSVSVS